MQKKNFFFVTIVCLILIVAVAIYWYQKPREDVTELKPAFTLTAKKLYMAFIDNEENANRQYLEKIILVKGTVNTVQVTDSTLNVLLSSESDPGGINCTISKKPGEIVIPPEKGANVQVKGRCIGFLIDVNLADAVIEN